MAVEQIIAIKLRSLGDTVLMTAPLLELGRAYPRAKIHVAVSEDWAPLLEQHPSVHKIWRYRRYEEKTARAKAIASLALKIRKHKYDVALNFHASPSSAILTFATGAPIRSIHFHGHTDKNRFSTVPIAGKGVVKPIIERDMDAVRALGIQVPEGRMPEIFLLDQELGEARSFLKRARLPDPVLAVGIGASRPTKVWPMARFAEIALKWNQETGGGVLAFASRAEQAWVDEFQEAAQACQSLFSVTDAPIRLLASLLAGCKAFIGNDSGPKHVAVAVGTPTLTLIGPEHPYEWHPYSVDQHPYLFIDSLECRKDADPGMPAWCGLYECVEEKHRCMLKIDADRAYEELRKVAKR